MTTLGDPGAHQRALEALEMTSTGRRMAKARKVPRQLQAYNSSTCMEKMQLGEVHIERGGTAAGNREHRALSMKNLSCGGW